MPTHVTGGLPIQQYLQWLLDRMPHPPPDDLFSLVSAAPFDDSAPGNSRSTLEFPSQMNALYSSSYKRESFINNYMSWAALHVRVKVNISGLDRSCYVWQSRLEDSISAESDEPVTGESADTLSPHELNISPPDIMVEDGDGVPPPQAIQVDHPIPDLVHGAAMFRL